jgi:cytochrome c oxidase subunit 2
MFSTFSKFADKLNSFIIPALHVPDKGAFSTVPNLAEKVDSSSLLVLVISLILLALVTLFMVYFALRYRKKNNPVPVEVKESILLEIAWTVIPTILVFIMFYVGWKNFLPMREVPHDAMSVRVNARMWSWQFQYDNGTKSSVLRVPVEKSVQLLMSSDDVIHSLYIPAFKIKEDTVPGMETTLWFFSRETGEYNIFCAEYCGQGHSSMLSKVIVMSKEEFDRWYTAEEKKKDGEDSKPDVMELLDENGCLECHSTDGSVIVGPTFKGILGREVIVISNGKEHTIITDYPYLKKSILYPDSDIVKDYPEVMPSFEGELSDREIDAIIEYLKVLK